MPSIVGLDRLCNQVLKLTNRRTLLYTLSYRILFRSLSVTFDIGALRHVQLTTTSVLFMSECFLSQFTGDRSPANKLQTSFVPSLGGFFHSRRVCCLLVLDSVTSTPQWIRQPKPRDVVHDVCVCVFV